MKKLFSLALVMMMITSLVALVGCNGLWGFDDDDDVVTPAGTKWTLKNKVELDSTAGLSLRAAAATGYDKLVANLFRVSDNTRMTTADVDVKDNGDVDDIVFTGDSTGTYTVKITHPDRPSFFMYKLVNQKDIGLAATPVNATTTAIAIIASDSKIADYTQISTSDAAVQTYVNQVNTYLATVVATTTPQTLPAAPKVVLVTSVSLNKTTLTLSLNTSETLVATVLPADATTKTVTWTTSDAAVATVDNTGKVTAVSGGTATIKVSSDSNPSLSATCVVTITVPVTGISLDKSTLTMDDGTTSSALVATIAPTTASNKNVNWTTSDATIATVANGVITALKPGTVTITATSAENSSFSASCVVTINAVAVASVSLNKTTASLVVGGTETLVATVAPANATVKTVAWTSSNTAVATVSAAGVVTAAGAGTANITVTTTDGSKTATCVVTVTAAPVAVTGVTLNKLTTSIAKGAKETLVATVAPTNASNQTVSWSSSNTAVATVSTTGEVSALAEGTSTITVTTADGSKTATCVVTVTAAATTTTVTFSSKITGATGSMVIVLQGTGITVPADTVIVTLKAIDGTDVEFKKDPTVTTAVSLFTSATKTLADFDTITFNVVLPSGTTVRTTSTGFPTTTVK